MSEPTFEEQLNNLLRSTQQEIDLVDALAELIRHANTQTREMWGLLDHHLKTRSAVNAWVQQAFPEWCASRALPAADTRQLGAQIRPPEPWTDQDLERRQHSLAAQLAREGMH